MRTGGGRRGGAARRRLPLAALLTTLLLAASASAAPPPGQAKAQACAVCHGPTGLSQMPNAPNLAGQPAIYLSEQLKAYRSGKRSNEIMNVIAKPLSDADIADLAAWFESIKISATLP